MSTDKKLERYIDGSIYRLNQTALEDFKKKVVVLYHANCADGFGAALAAWLVLGERADYIPVQYGQAPPNVRWRDVYILDFSYKRDVLIEMENLASSITLMDHHETAQEDLEGLPFCKFDMTKSGAVLAWEYFHNKPIPEFFLLLQDRDLWQWGRVGSKEISAALQTEPMTFENWSRFLDNDELYKLQDKGKIILDYQNHTIDKITSQNDLEFQTINGWRVPCINTTILHSEIGNELSKQYSFSATYFETKDKRIYSLRSSENGFNVAEIAKLYGGGGHAHAAGFSIPKPKINLNEFPNSEIPERDN